MIRNARINVNSIGLGSIEVDGVDMSNSVCGLSLNARVGEVTELQLIFNVAEVVADCDVELHMPDDTRDVLIGFGWTPPETESRSEQPATTTGVEGNG